MTHSGSSSKTCAVIGSGIAGLAVAIRLANKGYKVTVFEANDYAGGKVTEVLLDGYRFDMGPSVLTMPHYIDELFTISGENPRDHFNYTRLDPIFKYFFEDGTVINAYKDKNKLAEEFAAKTTVRKENILQFLKKSETKFLLTNDVFLQRSLHKASNYFNYSTLRGILNFLKIEPFKTMNQANQSLFIDQKIIDIFNRYASYNGSNPYQAPATLNVISHLEINLGAYYPSGGMHAITNSLVDLAMRLGVEFRFNSCVKEIIVKENKAQGIKTDKDVYHFDLIISNADIYKTYHHLMPGTPKPEKTLNQPKSSSVIVFYWGIKKSFPRLGLHNMFMSENAQMEFEHVFQKNTIYADPTVYLYISSKENSSDAPAGSENWFVMLTVPNNTGQDWDQIITDARKYAIKKLTSNLGEDISRLIGCESILDPRMIEEKTSSAFGAVYGNSSNGLFAAFLRHPNFSRQIKDLYFCGGSVHPGSSIPLCLLSAKITADLID